MPLADIKGQETACRLLNNCRMTGKIPHTMLFTGPDGCGKLTTALAFAQEVNCPTPVNGSACGACPACQRIVKEIDMDVRVYRSVKLIISKEMAMTIRNEATTTPNAGARKFLIIDDADRMKNEASNLLLKIFEEPPERTVFILLTANEHLILPTIKSRSVTAPFRPLSRDEAATVLGGRISAERLDVLHPLAKGNLGFIMKLADDETVKSVFADLEKFMSAHLAKPCAISPSAAASEFISIAGAVKLKTDEDTESTAQRKSVAFALEALLVFTERRFRDIIAGRTAGGREAINYQLMQCSTWMECIMSALKAVRGGGLVPMAMESLILDIKKTHAA